MRDEDFSVWLSAIAGLSERQRQEALRALAGTKDETPRAVADQETSASAKNRGRKSDRVDVLGRPAANRSKTEAARIAPVMRSSVGAFAWAVAVSLQELRRTFNALTTRRWRICARKSSGAATLAMIDAKSLAKTAQLCGIHPTTAFRWRHRFLRSPATGKPRSLSGIVEADETFILESFKGRWSDLRRKPRKRGGRQASGSPPGQRADPRGPRPERHNLDAVLPQFDSASIAAALAASSRRTIIWLGTVAGRLRLSHARPESPSTPFPRPESPGPRRLTCTSTASTPTIAASNYGWLASTASDQEPAELSRMEAGSRSFGRQARSRQLDEERYRKWAISTTNAIRAGTVYRILGRVGGSAARKRWASRFS